MKDFSVLVEVFLKPGIRDVESECIQDAINQNLTEVNLSNLVQTKSYCFVIQAPDHEMANTKVNVIAKKVLVNPQIQTFMFEVEEC